MSTFSAVDGAVLTAAPAALSRVPPSHVEIMRHGRLDNFPAV